MYLTPTAQHPKEPLCNGVRRALILLASEYFHEECLLTIGEYVMVIPALYAGEAPDEKIN